MTKNEFFTSLSNKLSILNEKERKDIIDEYIAHVEFKMQDGKTEEEAVADFGDIDDLVGEILEAYHIDNSASKTKSLEHYIKVAVRFVNQTTERLLSFAPSDIAKIIVEFFLVLIVILLLSWPFNALSSALTFYLHGSFLSPIMAILALLLELCKIAVGFLITYSFIKSRILSRNVKDNNSKENSDYNYDYNYDYSHSHNSKKVQKSEAAAFGEEKNQTAYAESPQPVHSSGGDFIINLVVNVLKIFLFIMVWLPAAVGTVTGIVCTVLVCILLAVKGLGFWGICIIGIGCCIIGIAFTAWLGEVIFGGKKKNA